jgi:diacylglycerol kinase (ATP)
MSLHAPQKSTGGIARVFKAFRYSLQGLRAAVQHEAAFRQELALGLVLLVMVPWVARSPWQALALIGVVLLVWVVELLNSALEALADAISTEHHPLLGRTKDLGSAAVLFTLLLAGLTWGLALWERFVG